MATLKQETVAKDLSENVGKPIGQAMRDAGYSESTSLTPQRLTDSKGWKELMGEALPEDYLLQKHRQFLDEPKISRYYKKGDLETEIEEWSGNAVKALDMAYKLKGSYAPEKSVTIHIHAPTERIKKLADKLNK